MIDYMLNHGDKLYIGLIQHLEILAITLVLSVALAAVLTLISEYIPRCGGTLINVFSAIYSIPSLALFALLIPITGLGMKSAIIVLVVYNQYLLLRNFLTGLGQVDSGTVEAAIGLGMNKWQVLTQIKLPLSKKPLFTGVRLAVVSTIGIATIAASINAGGLGTILFDGLRTVNTVKIVWGALLSSGLAIVASGVLDKLEKKI